MELIVYVSLLPFNWKWTVFQIVLSVLTFDDCTHASDKLTIIFSVKSLQALNLCSIYLMETINQNHEKSLNVGKDEVNNIQIFMNIEQKIDTLRHALQSLLKRDLEQHAFWLSNVKLLDPMQTLLDECATYTGFVQVDIDFLEDPKQIRINDVLQPAEEWIGHVEKAAAQFDGNPTNFVMIINSEPDLHSENLSDGNFFPVQPM